jgi:hypothetical protein
MKKILLTTALCLIGAASLMAQGRINFANTSPTGIRISGNADGSASLLLGTASTAQFGIGPGSTIIQLYAGLTSSSLAPVLIGTTLPYGNLTQVTNTTSGIAGAQGTFPGGSNLGLQGYDGSAAVFLQFTARSINGLYAGTSPIIQVNLATGAATATTLFVAGAHTATTWGSLTMVPTTIVPEPSSMVLAGLGAASLLLFRRRK